MVIRPVEHGDAAVWAALRARLWPDAARTAADEIRAYFRDGCIDGFPHGVLVAQCHPDPSPVIGFVEVSMRDTLPGHADGPFGFIEGWYVDEGFRRQGVGRALLHAAEMWARARSAKAMGSDTDPEHAELSIPAHTRCGFVPLPGLTGRDDSAVHFLKHLDPD